MFLRTDHGAARFESPIRRHRRYAAIRKRLAEAQVGFATPDVE
jgi:hypothetical protein